MEKRIYRGDTIKLSFQKEDDQASAELLTARGTFAAVADGNVWNVEIDGNTTQGIFSVTGLPYATLKYQFATTDSDNVRTLCDADIVRIWNRADLPQTPTYAEKALAKVEKELLEMQEDSVQQINANGISVHQRKLDELEAQRRRLLAEIANRRYIAQALEAEAI